MATIAIDFGTTCTRWCDSTPRVASPRSYAGKEVLYVIPSVIYIPTEGPKLFGDVAKEAMSNDPAGTARGLKREIKNKATIRRNWRNSEVIETR